MSTDRGLSVECSPHAGRISFTSNECCLDGTLREMTGPKEATAGHHEREARFRKLAELVADFYWETDAEHRFTVIEANGVTQHGFAAASRLGRTRWEVPSVAPDAEGWRAHRQRLEARLPFRHFETAHQTPDGEIHYYMVAGEPFFDAQGLFGGYWGVGREITERKRAEAALRESEERLSTTLHSIGDAVMSTDTEGRVSRMNPVAERLTGWSFAQAQGRPVGEVFRIVDGRTRAAAFVSVAKVLATGEVQGLTSHCVLIARDGTERPIADSAAPIRDAAGAVGGVVLVFRDVTQERRAEQVIREQNELLEQRVLERTVQLRESEARYRSYFDSSMDAQLLTAPDGSILDVNAAACKMLGRPVEGIKRLGRNALIDATDPRLRAALEERARTGTVRAEITMIRADGTKFPVEVASSVFNDAAGQPRTTMSIRDISERRQAEQRIQAQLEHLSLLDQITRSTGERLDLASIFQIVLIRLEDSLPVDFGCVCLYDPVANSLRVTSVGARSEALAHELSMGEHMMIDIDPNGLSRCVQGQLVYEPDLGQLRFPFPERLARGGLGSAVLAPLRSESRVFGVLVVARCAAQAFNSVECEFLRQLSEHVALAAHQAQLYGSLQQAYDDLRQTQAAAMQEERLRALGQMASGIAHDINNALSPVSLYVESMLESERNLSERARGYLETIQRAVEDVAQTVARMREFYRQREAQLVLAPVEVNDLVQQVLDLTRARWSDMPLQRGVVVQAVTQLAPGLPKIMGVESEIREALTNLVFNSVDAMPQGGTLALRTRLAQGDAQHPAVTVEVADTGTGMDEDTRRRCLEPFFTTKGERGTGLGLAMVFGMVQRHSAELEIDSAPGAGTTMRLVFAVPAAVQTEPGQLAGAPEVPTRLRLLLIDDDPILLKSLRDTLETDGHFIVTANGGEAGVAAFRTALGGGEQFAAVITDLGMPYVDGRRVATAVKEASPATPVILLTGWGQRLVADGDIPPHVDRVLAKPPRLREVREALASLCGSPPG